MATITSKQKEMATKMVYQLRNELIEHGLEVARITDVRFTSRCTKRYGACSSYNRGTPFMYCIITLSDILFHGNENTLRNTILHELVHAMPSSGRGHGYMFHVNAGKVNRLYPHANIGTYVNNEDREACKEWISQNKKRQEYKYKVTCSHCGKVVEYRKVKTKFIKAIEFNGGINYRHTSCGGKGGFTVTEI